MTKLREKLQNQPTAIRIAPFLIFLGLTFGQGQLGEGSEYWIYVAKTLIAIPCLLVVWPLIKELKWAFSWEAVVVGVAVFGIWVGLNPFYPKWGTIDSVWNPFNQYSSGVAWGIVVLRIAGTTLIVPALEEVFYRSFLYRYLAKPDFQSMPLGEFDLRSFVIVSAVFGFAHYEWLAGILCGAAYQWLVCRKKRLGDAMTAHAITNLLLGLYVVGKGDWSFW